MPAESSGLIIHSLCGPNGTGSRAEYNILINESGLSLAKDNGCCCCDVSCLTDCGGLGLPCSQGPCYISSSGSAMYFPTGVPVPACFDGGYILYRFNGCGIDNSPIWVDTTLPFIVWNDGYPAKYRPHRSGNDFALGYCLIWHADHGTNYGIDTCHSTYYDARCCFRYHRWFRLFKVECATQEIVDVTDEAVASFPDEPFGPGNTGWVQIIKGYYVKCAYTDADYEDHSGGDYDCTCCGADTKTIDDIYGPPILVCAP